MFIGGCICGLKSVIRAEILMSETLCEHRRVLYKYVLILGDRRLNGYGRCYWWNMVGIVGLWDWA